MAVETRELRDAPQTLLYTDTTQDRDSSRLDLRESSQSLLGAGYAADNELEREMAKIPSHVHIPPVVMPRLVTLDASQHAWEVLLTCRRIDRLLRCDTQL
eukprot:TRINITY_DN21225_c0_g1_i1.p1 TRINITY_DN21225_c0_g1~~TRINITY_DN21225_c0_g1_i1.p1  ORF type:complete len:100 (-),score=0.57 TRINITY_DN21225_c0_g1_i1:319-618(-)